MSPNKQPLDSLLDRTDDSGSFSGRRRRSPDEGGKPASASESSLTLDGPTTPEEFHDALRRLVRAAQENGVDVRGGWSVDRRDEGPSGVDVEITEVADRG